METFPIQMRALSWEEATRLSSALRETPNILGYVPNELVQFPDTLVAIESATGALAGVCLCKYLPRNWAEIAVLFVFPEFRGQGIGLTLFQRMFGRLRTEERTVLCVSREPTVLRWMNQFGMQPLSPWRVPFSVTLVYSRHYFSLYRMREASRKQSAYPNQPAFQSAVLRAPVSGRQVKD